MILPLSINILLDALEAKGDSPHIFFPKAIVSVMPGLWQILRQKATLPLHGNITFAICFPKWMENPPKKPLSSVFHKLYSKRSSNKVYYRPKVSA